MALIKNMNSQALTIVNPQAFTSLADIKKRLLKDAITDTVVNNVRGIIENIGRGINSQIEEKVGTLISKIAGDILKRDSIDEITMDYFRFRINPNKLSVPKKKIADIKYTGAGWDIDIRGQELIMYSYKGSTGSLVPDNILNGVTLPYLNELFSIMNLGQELTGNYFYRFPQLTSNPKLSSAYIVFKLFELFWEQNNDDLLIFWEDECYLGKFLNFTYEIDGMNPYQIMYSFDFAVYPEFKYNLVTGDITESDFISIQKRFNRFSGIEDNSIYSKIKDKALSKSVIKPITIGNSELTDKEQADTNWFSSLGAFPYGKDKLKLIQNTSLNYSATLSRITPRQMADWLKANSNIDIFEDNISFNLKKSITTQSATESGGGTTAVKDTSEMKHEEQTKVNNDPSNKDLGL
jgi:hypothetical protein